MASSSTVYAAPDGIVLAGSLSARRGCWRVVGGDWCIPSMSGVLTLRDSWS